MAQNDDLVLRIGVSEKRILDQMKRVEQRSIKAAQRSEQAFVNGNRKIVRSTATIDRSMSDLSRRAGGYGAAFAKSFAAPLISAFAAGSLTRNIRGVVSELSELGKVADRIGVGTEALQGLQHGFELSGVSASEFTSNMERFSRRIGDADKGTGQLAKTLKSYGVSLRDGNGEMRSQTVLLKEVADIMRLMGSEAERAAFANEAFGRGGIAMANALAQGGDAVIGFIDDAKDAGYVVEDELIRRAEELDDEFANLARSASTTFKTIAVGAASAVVSVAELLERLEEAASSRLTNLGNAEIFDRLNNTLGVTENGEIINPDVREAEAKIERLERDQEGLQQLIEENTQMGFDNTRPMQMLAEVRAEIAAVKAEAASIPRTVAGLRPDGTGIPLQTEGEIAAGTAANAAAVREGATSGVTSVVKRYQAIEKMNESFIAQQKELNSLTAEEIELRKRSERILKAAEAQGANPSEQQVRQLALAEQAAEEARKAASGGRARSRSSPGGSGGGRSGRSRETFDTLEAGAREIEQLERQISLLGMSTAEIAAQEVQWKALDAAKRAGIRVSAEMSAQIEAQADQVGRLTEELERGEVSFDQYQAGLERIGETFADIAFEAESFGDVVTGVLKRIAAEMFSSGVQGLIGNIFPAGSAGGNLIGSIFGGFRAGGGNVSSGRAYMVGEKEPELFVPGASGTVLNSAQIGRAMGAAGTGQAGYMPRVVINNNAPGVEVRKESVTAEEVRIIVAQGLAQDKRNTSDDQFNSGKA